VDESFFLTPLHAVIMSGVLETKEYCLKGFGRACFASLNSLQVSW